MSQLPEMFFAPQDIASTLKVKTRKVYDLINSGQLKALRVGRMFRIRATDLAAYVNEQLRKNK